MTNKLREDLKIVSHASNKHSCWVPPLELVLVERNWATWVAVTIQGINVLHFVVSTFSKGLRFRKL